jgi:hypothetical protein
LSNYYKGARCRVVYGPRVGTVVTLLYYGDILDAWRAKDDRGCVLWYREEWLKPVDGKEAHSGH